MSKQSLMSAVCLMARRRFLASSGTAKSLTLPRTSLIPMGRTWPAFCINITSWCSNLARGSDVAEYDLRGSLTAYTDSSVNHRHACEKKVFTAADLTRSASSLVMFNGGTGLTCSGNRCAPVEPRISRHGTGRAPRMRNQLGGLRLPPARVLCGLGFCGPTPGTGVASPPSGGR